jgi:hypothetical protein
MRQIWHAYDVGVTDEPGSAMSVHSDVMDVVAPSGVLRFIIPDDPGVGWAVEQSAAAELRDSLLNAGLGS